MRKKRENLEKSNYVTGKRGKVRNSLNTGNTQDYERKLFEDMKA